MRRRKGATVRRRLAALLVGAGLTALGPGAARAEDPWRLWIVRDANDMAALARGGECVRGTLFGVRALDGDPVRDGVALAAVLEIPASDGSVVGAGRGAGTVRDDADGWRIELEGGIALRADAGRGAAPGPALLLGRAPGRRDAEACRIDADRLSDGSAVARRLQAIGGARPVEVRIDR